MDFIYILLVCLFLLLLLSLSLLLNLLLYRSKTRSALSGETLPPGKTGWPVIGESLEFLRWPEKFIGYRMKKYSPHVFKTSLLGEQFAIFCGATGNKFLFSNENKLVQSWWPSSMDKIFPFSEHKSTNEESTKLRKMLPNFFKPNMLERYVGVMHQIAERHFGTRWERENQVVVYPLIKQFTFSNACRLFMSIQDPNDVAQLFCRFDEIAPGMFSMPVDLPGTRFRRAINAANYVRKKILAIIKQRKMDLGEGKALPMQDILSHMLLTTDENGMFMNELDIADKILGLLVAGHESINLTCTSIVKYLAELPHIYDGVYKEQIEILKSKAPGEMLNWDDLQKMKYSWNVACEVLRLSPPIQGTFRESIADFVYNGFLIPKGWKLYWSTNTTHKNPDIFPKPLKFDPLRFEGSGPAPFTFVPFGGGPRMCPGKEYARLELLVFMHHLVKRFKWELLFPNEKIVVYPMPIPVKGLPIRLHPHKA